MHIEWADQQHRIPSHKTTMTTTTATTAQQETLPLPPSQSPTMQSFPTSFWQSDHEEPRESIQDPIATSSKRHRTPLRRTTTAPITIATSSKRHRTPLRRTKTTPILTTTISAKEKTPTPPRPESTTITSFRTLFWGSDNDEPRESTKDSKVTSSQRHGKSSHTTPPPTTISAQQKALPPLPSLPPAAITSLRSLFSRNEHNEPHEKVKDPIVTATELLQERINALQQRIEYLEDRRAVSCRIHGAINDSTEDLKLRMAALEDRVGEQSTVTRAALTQLETGVTRVEGRMGGLVRSLWKIILKGAGDGVNDGDAEDEDEVADDNGNDSSCSSVVDDTFSTTDNSPCSTSATTPEDEYIPSSECLPLKHQEAPCYFSSAPIKVHFEDEAASPPAQEHTKRPRRRDDSAWLRTRTIWMECPTGLAGKAKQTARPSSMQV